LTWVKVVRWLSRGEGIVFAGNQGRIPGQRTAASLPTQGLVVRKNVIEGIKRALADIPAGRIVPHDLAMAELDAAIDEVASGYRAMAADSARGQSALEWSEALIGDWAHSSGDA
jgi:hypothetical protein